MQLTKYTPFHFILLRLDIIKSWANAYHWDRVLRFQYTLVLKGYSIHHS